MGTKASKITPQKFLLFQKLTPYKLFILNRFLLASRAVELNAPKIQMVEHK